MHVQLHNLRAGPLAGVFDLRRDKNAHVFSLTLRCDLQAAILEGCVGQAMTEWEQRLDVFRVVVAIADIDGFAVVDLPVAARVVVV